MEDYKNNLTKHPIKQQPVMCDFGQFAGGLCGNPTVLSYEPKLFAPNLTFQANVSSITVSNIFEEIKKIMVAKDYEKIKTTKFNITNNDGKVSIGIPQVIFRSETKINKTYNYTIETLDGDKLQAEITFVIKNDAYVPVAPVAKNKTFSFEETTTKNYDVSGYFTIDPKTTLNKSTVVITMLENEDNEAYTIEGTVIKVTPKQDISKDRVLKFSFKGTDNNDLESNTAIITITVKDFNIYTKSIWWGNSEKSTMDVSIIDNLERKTANTFTGEYTSEAVNKEQNYKWFIFPAQWGEPQSMKLGSFPFNKEQTPQYLEIGGVQMIGIRSFYTMSGPATITIA